MCRHVFLGTAAAIAVLVVAFGGAGSAVRADGGSISGTVYFDTDMDGQRDASEPAASNRTVELTRQGTYENARTTVSDASGVYRFDEVEPALDYELTVRTEEDTPCARAYRLIEPDEDWNKVDLLVVPMGEGRVFGRLINDLNEDGKENTGEPALAGWTVTLGGTPAAAAPGTCLEYAVNCEQTQTTDHDGSFEFAGLPEGEFGISSSSAGAIWEQTFPGEVVADPVLGNVRSWESGFEVTPANPEHEMDFGVHVLAGTGSIAGVLFSDLDSDGTKEEGEPTVDCQLADFFLVLHRRAPALGNMYVNRPPLKCTDGQWRIEHLEPGDYSLGVPWPCVVKPGRLWTTVGQEESVEGVLVPGCSPPEQRPEAQPTPEAPVAMPTAQLLPVAAGAPASVPDVGAPSTGSGGGTPSSDDHILPAALALAVIALMGLAFSVRRQTRRP